jgi:calreticulin
MRAILAFAVLAAAARATIFFNENFDNMDRWVQSESKSDFGKFVLSSGDTFWGDKAINQGLKTSENAKFYSAAAEIDGAGVSNEGKNLVVSLSVKHEQGLDCGGGYIKIGPEMEGGLKNFNGDTSYFLMFGPDQCGYTKKVHAIFGDYKTKGNNLLWKKEPRYPDDKLTHVYTLVVKPDNTYELFIDQESKESGSLEADWAFLKPKEIDDPSDVKPADWVEDPQMDDPEDKKPEDWDSQPEKITDPDAKQPEDWDTEDDGEWEAPQIPNPAFKGAWSPKRIPNPEYKGPWKAKQIANPEYEEDDKLYLTKAPLKFVGVDIWQVKAGTIFDNIIIGDDLAEVNEIIDKTWKATKDAEKTAHDGAEKKEEAPAADAAADEDDKEDL